MSRFRLILRNLRYFKGVNFALIFGMMVATAVLTGALMVGGSVQASLADLARQRLGPIDDALIARRFFDQSLADRLQADPELAKRYKIAPAVLLSGGAANENETVRAGDVQIAAAGGEFAPVSAGQCILNGPTATALALRDPGAMVLFSLPDKPDEVREATLSRHSREDTLTAMRSKLVRIDAASDMLALFNPNGGQRVPKNAWVNLSELQEQVELKGRVNTILVHDNAGGSSASSAEPLNQKLKQLVRLEDYGLEMAPVEGGQVALTSRNTYIDPPVVQAANRGRQSIPLQTITVNLLNTITLEPGSRQLHYAVAAGISPLDGHPLAEDEVAINQWTADQLGAKIGDRLHVSYFKRLSTGDLTDTSSDAAGFKDGFKIARILPMTGIGADRSLTPNYKGLTDADTVADWDPPEGVKINKSLVTKADDDYWHRYRAAPKVFLSFAAAEKLWGSPVGDVTSLRVPARFADVIRQKLQRNLDPAAMGLVFQPILSQQLAASNGSTDFGQYFLYFSFFIIVAALLLVAMLFRLNVEQRARQIGVLSAVGFAPWTLRRLALSEGMLLAAIGGLLGIPLAIAYTALIMYGLRTWWNGAVGTTSLYLHVVPDTLLYGYFGSLIVAFFAIWWAVWRVGRTRTATLLAGGWGATVRRRGKGTLLRWTGVLLALIAVVSFVSAAFSSNSEGADYAFLGGGTFLLIACLCWIGGFLRPGARRSTNAARVATVRRLGVRNAARHTARSVLAAGLIAFAAFTLITIAAFRQGAPNNTGTPESGSGGYRLIATAGIPLLGDLNTQQGRRVLGMTDAADPLWNDAHFVSMRRWQGQDISCLNLTQPTTPTILSVPPVLMRPPDKDHKHRFTFAQGSGENPWQLLDQHESDGSIPVIADANTAQYILHQSVGDTIDVPDAAGTPHHLKLVATLGDSIFQSELLMSEPNFRQLFPTVDGFGVVLVDCPQNKQDQLAQTLNTQLGEYAVDTEPTKYRLARYLEIQNTYLSTFQALGALGLMLGTIGLAVVLVRTVVERRAELALLASLGFRRLDRIVLILSENVFLLVLGLVVGTVCALLGILPALLRAVHGVNLGALIATLAIVLLIGVISSTIAVWISGAHISPADLRHE